jgi:DNA-binding IclR family transcriptional regulator
VHQERGRASRALSYYERGVAMPLFVGAASKVILAHLDERTLRRSYLENSEHIARATGCRDLKSFRAQLREIRRDGSAVTTEELGPRRVGFAAPILVDGTVVAGLSLGGFHTSRIDAQRRVAYTKEVMKAAQRISRGLARSKTWIARG